MLPLISCTPPVVSTISVSPGGQILASSNWIEFRDLQRPFPTFPEFETIDCLVSLESTNSLLHNDVNRTTVNTCIFEQFSIICDHIWIHVFF